MARRAQYRVAGWPAVQRAESLAGSYGVRDLKAGSYWVGNQSCDAQALRAGSGGVRNLMAPLPFNKKKIINLQGREDQNKSKTREKEM